MSLNLEQKQEVVAEIAAQLGNAQALIVAEYRGLNVESVTGLRASARKSGVYLRVLMQRGEEQARDFTAAEAEENCSVMAAEQLMDFLENGNIHNSVNYPRTRMARDGVFQCGTLGHLIADVGHHLLQRRIRRFLRQEIQRIQ